MKKAIIILVVVGLLGYAVYDFAIKSDDAADKTEDENDDVKVGLEQGNRAPDFELETLNGDVVKLSDYRGGRVMLNFWAFWCGPCRSEMPDMQKLHEEKDITILAVNLSDTESSPKNVPNFVEDLGLEFPILLDENSEVATLYQIQPVPTSFMIDSNGLVQNKALGALNYEQMVQQFNQMD